MNQPRFRRGAAALWATLGLLGLGGCWVTERYVVPPEQLLQAAQIPAAEVATTALPVHRYAVPVAGRESMGKAVYLRADALQEARPEPDRAPMVVRSRRYSPVVTAGVVLMSVGSAVSIVFSIVYFASLSQGGDLPLTTGVITLSAEPFMLAGTLMWIFGISKPPQEVGGGHLDMHYLNAIPTLTPPALAPAPPPALSLRF